MPSTVMSTTERVRAAYARIAQVDRPSVWITLRDENEALAAAAEIDARVADGASGLPLAGLIFAVKDNIDVVGFPTTAAHPEFAYEPAHTATAVQRLIDAGALVLGKTNLDQFATGLVGTRSPYGVVRSATHDDRVAGGSSSGSAAAVGLAIVDFGLGTDTAGSGRVPAAFNGIVGVKSTMGLVPVDGVVPACRSYDCVTAFAPTIALAQQVTQIMTGPSETDVTSRAWPDFVRLAAGQAPVIAVPVDADLELLSPQARQRFNEAVATLTGRGAVIGRISTAPFMAASALLYDGALVAERFEAYGPFLIDHPDAADPSVLGIVTRAGAVTGPAVIADQHRLLSLKAEARELLVRFDALLVPTAVEHPTIAAVTADPLGVNSRLGTFTSFVNLLDMAAVAVPAGQADGGQFGVSVIVRAFDDQIALDVAGLLLGETTSSYPSGGISLVVVGAHMRGLPLNPQMSAAGARFVGPVTTSSDYRLFALSGELRRPGLVPVATGGVAVIGEEWQMSPAGLGAFTAGLQAPMALGPIRLADGRIVLGFQCALPDGEDISDFGGWRAYLDSLLVTS
jgi:allophanate hydrolase